MLSLSSLAVHDVPGLFPALSLWCVCVCCAVALHHLYFLHRLHPMYCLQYCKYIGLVVTGLIVVGMVGGQAVALAADWWLAMWARAAVEDQDQSKCVGMVDVFFYLCTCC